MAQSLLVFAALLQAVAVVYGFILLHRRRVAASAWICLLGAMLSMLTWRVVTMLNLSPPAYFNPLIAIWGSSCMMGSMFLFGRVVAARERAEIERDALLASERAARSEAERANLLKDEFLGTVSHELRTPLAAILGWCAVLEKTRDAPQNFDRALDAIQRNARIQTRLVDDLLDVTRIRAGNLHLERIDLPLDSPVRAAMQTVRPQADAKNLAVTLQCEQSPMVTGDAARLEQLVTNLLVNAIKFTPNGGRISVVTRQTADQAIIEISDTGDGIAPDFMPQLFSRFRQHDSSNKRRHGGLGLGLSIAAELARLQGGSIQASSPGLGLGATFTVSLPVAAANASTTYSAASDAANAAAVEAKPLKGLSIMLIDDEADVRDAVSQLLTQFGVEVTALASGADVAQTLADKRPDLMLIDIGMPVEDGYSLIRRIRKLPRHSGGDVPAISLTAHAREEDRARALQAGFQQHLPKPIDVARLTRTIVETIQHAVVDISDNSAMQKA